MPVPPFLLPYRRRPVSTAAMDPGLRRDDKNLRSASSLAAVAIAAVLSSVPAQAAEPQHCVRAEIVLWGDGRHDDSAALNAWFGGADAIWAESGVAVGPAIAG